jgi:hypothetical protein
MSSQIANGLKCFLASQTLVASEIGMIKQMSLQISLKVRFIAANFAFEFPGVSMKNIMLSQLIFGIEGLCTDSTLKYLFILMNQLMTSQIVAHFE